MEFITSEAFDPSLLLALFFVALFAGFIDAVAGGGGLLTIPALLLAQVPPIQALATNKLQASFGTFSAAMTMVKRGQVNLKQLRITLLYCFIGAVLGTWLVQISSPEWLEYIVPFVISVICFYFLFAPNPGEVEANPRVSEKSWQRFFVPTLGFYDGYLGPGAGMFYTLGAVALRGRELIQATANAKVLNLTSNLASLVIFVLGGNVVWVLGLAMLIGQLIGGNLGAHAVLKGGARFIRPVIVVVCLCMLAKNLIV